MNEDWETGRTLFREERYEEAIPYLERAGSAPDGDDAGAVRGPALNHLGMAQYVLGRYEDAVATFQAAIEQTPGKARLHYNLGNSLLAVHRSEEAKRQYETALDLDPDYDEAREALVVVAADLARPKSPKPAPPKLTMSEPSVPDRPARISPPAPPAPSTDGAPPSDLADILRQIESLDGRLRAARDALLETRRLLERQEQTERDLVEQLLSAVRTLAAKQDEALRDAALKQAQALLSAAASRLGGL